MTFGSIQASCIDSTAAPEAVFADEVKKLQSEKLKPKEQITLEPYERDHAVVVGSFKYVQFLMSLSQFNQYFLDLPVKAKLKKKQKMNNILLSFILYIQQFCVGIFFACYLYRFVVIVIVDSK